MQAIHAVILILLLLLLWSRGATTSTDRFSLILYPVSVVVVVVVIKQQPPQTYDWSSWYSRDRISHESACLLELELEHLARTLIPKWLLLLLLLLSHGNNEKLQHIIIIVLFLSLSSQPQLWLIYVFQSYIYTRRENEYHSFLTFINMTGVQRRPTIPYLYNGCCCETATTTKYNLLFS